nr:hypothetical protein [Tanacetum cinerariifolium]GEZ38383.1 hypothetical protein [Tanacetum cinerariifolium]
MIITGAENRPLMLERSMYDSWKSQNGTTKTKKYEELSVAKKLQADCDLKATNIVLQGLSPDVYAIVNHHKVAKQIWDRDKLLMQGTKLSLQERECKLYDEFDNFSFVKGETLYQYYWSFAQLINNMNVINMSMRPVQATIQDGSVTVQQVQWRQGQSYAGSGYKGNATTYRGYNMQEDKLKLLNAIIAQTEDLDAYDSDCDDVSNAKAVLMANLSNYGCDVISDVPHFEPYHNDMDNQSVHAMQDFEQVHAVVFIDNEITSNSNIILYS